MNSIKVVVIALVIVLAGACDVYGQSIGGGLFGSSNQLWVPVGYARYAPATVKALTDAPAAGVALPATAKFAVIYVGTASVNYRDDGTAPTATEGVTITAGSTWVVEGRDILLAFKFIDVSAASDVRINYYRAR